MGPLVNLDKASSIVFSKKSKFQRAYMRSTRFVICCLSKREVIL